jgi:serpin B
MQYLLAGDISLQDLNEYLYSYVNELPSTETSKLDIANSIWFRNDESLQVEDDFLRLNATYFMAQIFSAAFNEQTVTEINEWIDTSTDGMINNVIDDITDEVMFLINAVAFDAEWQKPYNEWTISDGTFTDESGNGHNVEFMFSGEWGFLDDGMATGFIKPYADNSYSFVALLPNEGISIDEYVHSLSGEGFLHTLESRQQISVDTYMPKFEFEYEISLVDALISLGMIDAFDARNADFSKIATSSFGNLFVSDVLHKTFISVDELGTRAGAVTVVEIAPESALLDEPKVVRLDRPFVFAIVDNSANLPIFIGTVMTV